MSQLTTTVGVQGIAKIVESFDGSKPKNFKNWTKSIEKYATLTKTSTENVRLVAYQSSHGPVSDFLKRYLSANRNHSWDQITQELKIRFGEVIDSQHALLMLRRVKQNKGESIQVYAERLLALAEDAFEGQDDASVQRQLIGYFIDGLLFDFMKMKRMRDNPNTFNDAVKSATGEQNLRKRFTLRTGIEPKDSTAPREEEPMDISHTRPKITCFYCKKRGHRVKDCRVRMKNEATVNAAQRNEKQQLGKKPNIVCYNCQGIGHIARECPNSNFQVGWPQIS